MSTPRFKESKEPTSWVRLKYSRRLNAKHFTQESFYELFEPVSILSIRLVKIVSVSSTISLVGACLRRV